jgi:hypothetical protein
MSMGRTMDVPAAVEYVHVEVLQFEKTGMVAQLPSTARVGKVGQVQFAAWQGASIS